MFNKSHTKLEDKFGWYKNWHKKPFASKMHYGLIVLFVLIMASTVFYLLPQNPKINEAASIPGGYPKLGVWWPNNDTQSVSDRARYDWLEMQNYDANHIAELRAANPNIKLFASTSAREIEYNPTTLNSPDNDLIKQASNQWLLTQAGSTLTSGVTATVTAIPVADGSKFTVGDVIVIEEELAIIQSKSGNTLTVKRGMAKPAAAHSSGVRIASAISQWSDSLTYDVTSYCPKVDVGHGAESFIQWNARRSYNDLHSADSIGQHWDGAFIDVADSSPDWLVRHNLIQSIDYNRNNQAPTSYDAFATSWDAGMASYATQFRALAGDSPILVANGGAARSLTALNGATLEDFPVSNVPLADWQSAVFGPKSYPEASYQDWSNGAKQPNYTNIITYQYDTTKPPTGWQTGFVPDYQKMRFGLTTTLLGNGTYSWEISTTGHATLGLYWFDEYDNAGTGKGYLGQPVAAAYQPQTNVYRRDFQNGIAIVNPTASAVTVPLGGNFRKIHGTQVPTINDGSLVTSVTLQPRDGIVLLREASTPAPAPDTTKPTVSLTAPTANATVSATINLSATAADNVGVTKVEFYNDATLLNSDTTSPYTFSWNTTTVANGTHVIKARAYDAAGNTAESTANVTVNNVVTPPPAPTPTAPSVSFSTPTSGATVSGQINVNVTASDTAGISKVEIRVDGVLKASDNTSPYAYILDTSTLANGSHTINAKAYNTANLTAEANTTVTVANTLNASLSVSPATGNAPLSVSNITAVTGGTTSGTTNYTLYCNRVDTGTNITTGYAAKLDASTETTYTAPAGICNSAYTTAGTYTAKLIVERGTLASESRTTVTVGSGPAPVALTATQLPANGTTQVAKTITVKVAFSNYLDATTVNTKNIKLKRYKDNTNIAATVNYDASTKTVSIKPTKILSGNTKYYVYLNRNVTDLAGNHAPQWDSTDKSSHYFQVAWGWNPLW